MAKETREGKITWPTDRFAVWPSFNVNSPTDDEITMVTTWFATDPSVRPPITRDDPRPNPTQLKLLICTVLECHNAQALSKAFNEAVEANIADTSSSHGSAAHIVNIGTQTAQALMGSPLCRAGTRPWKEEAATWARAACITLARSVHPLGKRRVISLAEEEEEEEEPTPRKRKRPVETSAREAPSTPAGKPRNSSSSSQASANRWEKRAKIIDLTEEDTQVNRKHPVEGLSSVQCEPLCVYSLVVTLHGQVDEDEEAPPYVVVGVSAILEHVEDLPRMEDIRCEHISWDNFLSLLAEMGQAFDAEKSRLLYTVDLEGELPMEEQASREIYDESSFRRAVGTLYHQRKVRGDGMLQLSVVERERERE